MTRVTIKKRDDASFKCDSLGRMKATRHQRQRRNSRRMLYVIRRISQFVIFDLMFYKKLDIHDDAMNEGKWPDLSS